MLHIENELRHPLAMDKAPEGSICEWCGKPAGHLFIVLGEKCQDERVLLCRSCAEAFVCTIASSLSREITPEEAIYG